MLQVGKQFPNFLLPNQDNKMKSLKNYSDKWLVLYVYPKDDTTGCTAEGKAFSAKKEAFAKIGVDVVGVSQDSVKSHKDFCNKYSFTMDLLADLKAEFLNTTGIGQTEHNGTLYWNRTTFVIDPLGVLQKIYEHVKPLGHAEIVLSDIQEMQMKAATYEYPRP